MIQVFDEYGEAWLVARNDPGWSWKKYAPTALSVPMLLHGSNLDLDKEIERVHTLLEHGWNPAHVGDILIVLLEHDRVVRERNSRPRS